MEKRYVEWILREAGLRGMGCTDDMNGVKDGEVVCQRGMASG